MTALAQDLSGLAAATMLMPFIAWLPGLALVVGCERMLGLDPGRGWTRCGWALLLSLAVQPAIDALCIRLVGLAVTSIIHLALAVVGAGAVIALLRSRRIGPHPLFALLPLWWLAVAFAFVDVDRAGRLNQSLIVLDLVKHASVIESLAQHGLPLRDAFFARPAAAGYYYYYYLGPAMVRWLGHGLVDSRMAFAGSAFWTGIALPAALWRIAVDAGLIASGRRARAFIVMTALCFVGGADLPFALLRTMQTGLWYPQVDWWSEAVSFAFGTVLWVPHHLSALLAIWIGADLLERARVEKGARFGMLGAGAGLAFASGFGMSVWIAVAAVPILAAWQLALLGKGRAPLLAFILAVTVALLVAAPQIGDLISGRAQEGFPLAPYLRPYGGIDAGGGFGSALILILLLPVGYMIEFGAFAYGAIAFLAARIRRPAPDNPLAVLLLISAAIGLVEASFVRSTIINNDFGWRSIWFAQLPAIIWTGAILTEIAVVPLMLRMLIAVGVLANAWDLFGLRSIPPEFRASWEQINAAPAVDYSERQAYRWAERHLPADAVLQANPGATRRVFNFGLYGRNGTAVADGEANLFGAPRRQVIDRISRLRPIFERALPPGEIAAIARREGIDAILFSARDPVWRQNGAPPPGLRCAYRDPRVCIAEIGSPSP
ncbi:hypothetical protein LZK98_19325 [Sphingomonas cannabina]|uniref:hypothetical protein n=1 Tax=Sphingomonas cannabina TaxID=2899123 RepID=UPI001F15D299|nr:hypothetical protein [Sphingomonas cannabina]UIJ45169.1 hypothetical protein LZK98_19325 [Sphingomonas cannabina]